MNVAEPQSPLPRWLYRAYVVAFFLYLAAPLAAAAMFAFNDSLFPALPWNGFTLDWFFTTPSGRSSACSTTGGCMQGLVNSFFIGVDRLGAVGRGRHLQRLPVRAAATSRARRRSTC